MTGLIRVQVCLIDLRGIDSRRRYSSPSIARSWHPPFGEYRRVLDALIANGIGFVHGGGHPTGFIVAVRVQTKERKKEDESRS